MLARLVLFGAGGHAKDIAAIATAAKRSHAIDFMDDERSGPHIIGPIRRPDYWFSIGVFDPHVRARLDAEYGTDDAANIVHPSAIIGPDVEHGGGLVMAEFSVLKVGARLGRHVHLAAGAQVNQGTIVGDYCSFGAGAIACGDVTIGARVMIGTGAVIRDHVRVGDDCVIGAGTAVVADLPNGARVGGVPAKPLPEPDVARGFVRGLAETSYQDYRNRNDAA